MAGEQDAAQHERIAEGAVARRVHQAIPYLLAALGFLLVRALGQIEQNQAEEAKARLEQGKQLSRVESDVRVLNARFDYTVVEGLTDLKRRVEVIERATKTP